jgi:ribonuclease-3
LTASLDKLQQVLNYRFKDITYLQQALTHRSIGVVNNERLEFLGDSVLNFCVARRLYLQLPDAAEGDLSRIRASLVNKDALARIAKQIGLADFIRLGRGEKQSGGQRRASILSDAMEAIFGAVLVDGGFDAVRELIQRLYQYQYENLPDPEALKDPKTRLQEHLQARGLGLPQYQVTRESGKDHAKQFEVSCIAGEFSPVVAEGNSRRKAEQAAASKMLNQILDVRT